VEVTQEGHRSCGEPGLPRAAHRQRRRPARRQRVALLHLQVPGHCAAGMKLQVRVSDAECTRTMPPPASPGAPSPGIRLCPGGPPTVIMTPGVISYGSGAGVFGQQPHLSTCHHGVSAACWPHHCLADSFTHVNVEHITSQFQRFITDN